VLFVAGCGRVGYDNLTDDSTHPLADGGTEQRSHCVDGVQSGDESDVDCGGSCAACDEAGACVVASDCASGACVSDRCAARTRCEDALLCEAFETQLTTWQDASFRIGEAALSSELAHGGAQALAAFAEPHAAGRVEHQLHPAQTAGPLHARGYFYLPATTHIASYAVLMELTPADTSDKISFDVYSDDRAGVVVTTGAHDGFLSAPGAVPRDRWFCAELAIEVDDLQGHVALHIDGDLAVQSTLRQTVSTAGFEYFLVGIYSSPDNEANAEVFIDDVIVANAPIGCD